MPARSNDHLISVLDELLAVELDGAICRTRQAAAWHRRDRQHLHHRPLGEDEDWHREIGIEMMPEDGIIAVYGVRDDYVPTFTDYGIEICANSSEIHKTTSNACPLISQKTTEAAY